MSTASSNIRVFIDWTEPTVFAGEEIECNITFKNIAVNPLATTASVRSSPTEDIFKFTDGQRLNSPLQSKSGSNRNFQSTAANRGHRTTHSLSSTTSPGLHQNQRPLSQRSSKLVGEGNPHRRSVSIISIGTAENGVEPRRASKGHTRSASLQIVPRNHAFNLSVPTKQCQQTRSPSHEVVFFSRTDDKSPIYESNSNKTPDTSRSLFSSEKFPSPFSPLSPNPRTLKFSHSTKSTNLELDGFPSRHSQRRDSLPVHSEYLNSQTDVVRPCSKWELVTSNGNPSDIFDAEHHPRVSSRTIRHDSELKQASHSFLVNYQNQTETLMMGYAQLHGSFTLDSSLVNQTPFEAVKRKGVISGQGGGVVGVEVNKRDSRLLRGFGWANIGESIGDLLGSGERSSIKDLQDIVDSGPVPLLSTPQSILFVNLCLGPGESHSYMYSFKLPDGLPPSHRGKAIKINYKLVIGTQRPGGIKEHQVKSIEIPFRVLGSVGIHGELLSHDLMSPYIILQEKASVKALSDVTQSPIAANMTPKSSDSTLNDFLLYVDQLLTKPRQSSSLGLISPSETSSSRRSSHYEMPATTKQAIDMAILRSKMATDTQQNFNKFYIARGGKKVAVLMLTRQSYRLGESVTVAIDFTGAKTPCYAIHAALESSEKIDASISLRTEASVFRSTRKAHASHSESTLFSKRLVFTPTIPISATPEFMTSGISLEWRMRVEFVTPRLECDNKLAQRFPDLLKVLSNDDRGIVLSAVEALDCECFDIAIPLRIYGTVSNSGQDTAFAKGFPV